MKATVVLTTWSPTKQRLEVLKKSLESLRSSTKTPHRLIIIDNGPERQTDYLNTLKYGEVLTQDVNIGIGAARNLGIELCDTPFIAFVDNDIIYFKKWLKSSMNVLNRFYNWPLIASPILSAPMRKSKHCIGNLGSYKLFNRASPQCWVMRKSDCDKIGKWSIHSKPGTSYCDKLYEMRYRFVWHPNWKAKHLCKKASYNHRNVLINGTWVDRKRVTA